MNSNGCIFSKNLFETEIVIVYRQFDMLYNLGRSKTTFGVLEKPPYKDLKAFLMAIFGINIVDNLEPSRFYLKSDLTVGNVLSSVSLLFTLIRPSYSRICVNKIMYYVHSR